MTDWYKKNLETITKEFGVNQAFGLSKTEADEHLRRYGPNKLPESKPDNLFVIFLRQFQSPLIYLLLAASVLVMFLEEWIDAGIIIFVLLFNAIAGTIQAGKAQNTLLALRKFTETNTTVLRDGKEVILPDHEVVPGDILILQEGDKIPADARIISAHNLRIDESAFSGESLPSSKIAKILEEEKLSPAEQKNMVFKGTHIVGGNGKAVVVATGLNTEIGRISEKISEIKTEIPLQKNIKNLSNLIIIVVLFVSSLIFFLGLLTGKAIEEIFLLSVSIIISAVPEGLPIVITLLLATGVWRMSKRNVLIKKLQAVEALGQAKIIAVDKTGTLTKSQLVTQKLYLGSEENFSITGVGYDSEGEITFRDKKIFPEDNPLLKRAGLIAGLCSNAKIFKKDGSWKISGDPTEAALSILAVKTGWPIQKLEDDFHQIAEIPFDYKLKYHAVLHKIEDKKIIFISGAPEIILNLCKKIKTKNKEGALEEEKRKEILDIFSRMSGEALRVLALAEKNTDKDFLEKEDITDLTFVGLCGMKDALREEVPEAMAKTREAGVKVVMITGDHKITAEAIAKEAGIWKKGDKILTAEELENLPKEKLAEILPEVSVFARITPENKLKIIEAYKLRGETVAMTGDGVNDALSLVAADLGVSMGKGGTEVAKEASDLVLLDDNFGSIVSAVEEGRSIYRTLRKVLLYLFATSLGEIMVIAAAILIGLPLPILAAQLIWLNLVTDGFLDVSLAMEPKEKDILKEKYKKPNRWILNSWDLQRMILNASTMAIISILLFIYFLDNYSYEHALSISLTTMAVFQWFKAWICRSDHLSIFQINPFSNKYLLGATGIVVILQLLALHTPFMQNILRLTPLSLNEWILIISICLTGVAIDEIRKMFYRKFEMKKNLVQI